VEFTSSSIPLLLCLKRDLPQARIGLFARMRPEWITHAVYAHLILGDVVLGKFDVMHVPVSYVAADLVERLVDKGISVHAADVNNADDIVRAVAAGVQRLSTDDVALVKRLIVA
jgi:glycerophosphoryl diester phosphodiesterase